MIPAIGQAQTPLVPTPAAEYEGRVHPRAGSRWQMRFFERTRTVETRDMISFSDVPERNGKPAQQSSRRTPVETETVLMQRLTADWLVLEAAPDRIRVRVTIRDFSVNVRQSASGYLLGVKRNQQLALATGRVGRALNGASFVFVQVANGHIEKFDEWTTLQNRLKRALQTIPSAQHAPVEQFFQNNFTFARWKERLQNAAIAAPSGQKIEVGQNWSVARPWPVDWEANFGDRGLLSKQAPLTATRILMARDAGAATIDERTPLHFDTSADAAKPRKDAALYTVKIDGEENRHVTIAENSGWAKSATAKEHTQIEWRIYTFDKKGQGGLVERIPSTQDIESQWILEPQLSP